MIVNDEHRNFKRLYWNSNKDLILCVVYIAIHLCCFVTVMLCENKTIDLYVCGFQFLVICFQVIDLYKTIRKK